MGPGQTFVGPGQPDPRHSNRFFSTCPHFAPPLTYRISPHAVIIANNRCRFFVAQKRKRKAAKLKATHGSVAMTTSAGSDTRTGKFSMESDVTSCAVCCWGSFVIFICWCCYWLFANCVLFWLVDDDDATVSLKRTCLTLRYAPPPEEPEEEFDDALVVFDKYNSDLNMKVTLFIIYQSSVDLIRIFCFVKVSSFFFF